MCDRVNTSNFPSGNQIILSCESSKMDGSSLICDMVRWPSIMELVSVSFSFNSINTYRSITWRSSINFIYTIFNVYGELEVVQIMFRSRCYCEMRTKGRKNWAKCIFSIVVRHTMLSNYKTSKHTIWMLTFDLLHHPIFVAQMFPRIPTALVQICNALNAFGVIIFERMMQSYHYSIK